MATQEGFHFTDLVNQRESETSPVPASESEAQPEQAVNDAPWRQGWDLTEDERDVFRKRSVASRQRKASALRGEGPTPLHPVNEPRLDPAELMPRLPANGLRVLSLFSGGGGLDYSFEAAGFKHVASYDILDIAGATLQQNRPQWAIHAGVERGDVCKQSWTRYRGEVDILHGGPPCQPFSMAGRQLGSSDTRDMFPEFVRAVNECRPRAFVAENVAALGGSKFESYLAQTVYQPLTPHYHIERIELKAEWFGVPQFRTRLFFVGFLRRRDFEHFHRPGSTHLYRRQSKTLIQATLGGNSRDENQLPTMGAREALGLPDTGVDDLAPTIRSGFTGPRRTTSVNSSVSALKAWGRLGIWPNGVAADRHSAHLFVPENRHFRLSVQDCAILQGFPANWHFVGAVYSILGQVGNSVAPPMGYHVARAVARAILR